MTAVVTFSRDMLGRVTSHGDLVAVTDRSGETTQLVYDAPRPHYLGGEKVSG